MSEPTSSKPYVSLRDRLRNAGKLMEEIGGHLPAPNEIVHLLGGLIAYAEHGDDVLNASTSADLEQILTPERAEGYVAPNLSPADARDVEIERLRRQLSESQQNAQDRGVQSFEYQGMGGPVAEQPPAPLPVNPGGQQDITSDTNSQLAADNAMLRQQLAAMQSAQANPEGVTVESEETAQDAVNPDPVKDDVKGAKK